MSEWFAALGNVAKLVSDNAIKNSEKQREVKNLINQGYGLFQIHKYEEALTYFEKAIQIKHDSFNAWNNRSAALSRLGRYQEALESSNHALKINSNSADAWSNISGILINLHRYEEALEACNQALDIDSNSSLAQYNKACIYGLQGDVKLAVDNLRKAINLDKSWKEKAKNDSDFNRVCSDPQFSSLLQSKN